MSIVFSITFPPTFTPVLTTAPVTEIAAPAADPAMDTTAQPERTKPQASNKRARSNTGHAGIEPGSGGSRDCGGGLLEQSLEMSGSNDIWTAL